MQVATVAKGAWSWPWRCLLTCHLSRPIPVGTTSTMWFFRTGLWSISASKGFSPTITWNCIFSGARVHVIWHHLLNPSSPVSNSRIHIFLLNFLVIQRIFRMAEYKNQISSYLISVVFVHPFSKLKQVNTVVQRGQLVVHLSVLCPMQVVALVLLYWCNHPFRRWHHRVLGLIKQQATQSRLLGGISLIHISQAWLRPHWPHASKLELRKN